MVHENEAKLLNNRNPISKVPIDNDNSSSKTSSLSEIKHFASKWFLKLNKEHQYSVKNQKIDLKTVPKRLLKKCRLCCFKKRSCFMTPSLCTALEKRCFNCWEKGHFPKSKKCLNVKHKYLSISQLDGNETESESSFTERKMIKEVYAANCEVYEIKKVWERILGDYQLQSYTSDLDSMHNF